MANIFTYWCEDYKELVNMSHNALTQGVGCRTEIVLDDSHDLFTHGNPQDVYRMNATDDGIELK